MSAKHTPNFYVPKIQGLMAQKNWKAASELAVLFSQEHPENEVAWILAAQCAIQVGQMVEAVEYLEQAIHLTPSDVMLKWQLLKILESLGHYHLAVPLAQDLTNAILTAGLTVQLDVLFGLAGFLMTQQQFNEAEKIWLRINQVQPDRPDVILNLATIKQYQGHLTEAQVIVDSILKKYPEHPDVLYFLAYLRRHDDTKIVDSIETALCQNSMPPHVKAKLHYALAKILEDNRLYANSFEHRKLGAALFRSTFTYDVRTDVAFIEQIKKTFTEGVVNEVQAVCSNESPVFIVGLPRSGTTLLERIVANHDDVVSAGELIYFNRLMTSCLRKISQDKHMSSEQMVSVSTQLDFAALGRDYLLSAQACLSSQSRFIDKHPINALYLGLIHKALPAAKFIILDRQPMDVCYAVYKQLFAPGIYQFSYDLQEMAAYYQAHAGLMDHWQKVMPDAIHRVNYEDLVSDTKATSKRVMAFCGLAWQDGCLDLGRNKQAAATASASQVRGKVYNSSVGLWKNYSEELIELKQALKY